MVEKTWLMVQRDLWIEKEEGRSKGGHDRGFLSKPITVGAASLSFYFCQKQTY